MTLRFPFSICSPLPPSLASSLRRRFSASSPPAAAAALSFTPPPTSASAENLNPLFLRPLSFAASRSDLLDFRRWAESLALASGPRLSSDGGPREDLLRRELAWMLEDAAADSGVGAVRLRVELEELYRLWRERIEERRPLQYIVGCEHWRDLVLVVNEGVLIPRPETEMVVDLVAEVEGFEHGLWADLGTGCGAISVGIGRMLREGGRVFATDLSPIALEIARFNVERHGLKDKIELRQGSWFEPLRDVEGKLTGLVSNPPYIPSANLPGLQAEVGQHEPELALDGGADGMDHLLHLCHGSASALKPGGFFAFETNGDEQSKLIADSMTTRWAKLFHSVKIVPDFAGIQRFVTGFRSS